MKLYHCAGCFALIEPELFLCSYSSIFLAFDRSDRIIVFLDIPGEGSFNKCPSDAAARVAFE